MAVYPNNYCLGFCNWMLNTSWQTLTPSRLTLITSVYNAALNGTSVTDTDYNNFVQVTSWRQPYYESYLSNQLPLTSVPVAGCDFWLNPTGLVLNSTNLFGQVNAQGQILQLNDCLGGSVYGTPISLTKSPSILALPSLKYQPNAISINTGAIQLFNITNGLNLTKNITGYTLFAICNIYTSGAAKEIVYFSSGTSGGAERIGIKANTSGQYQGAAKRLDADALGTLTGGAASTSLKIVCFVVDYSTGAGTIYENGTQTNTNASLVSTGSTSNTASVAAQIGALNGGTNTNGIILDVLGFNSALSAANVLTVSDWLNSLRSIY